MNAYILVNAKTQRAILKVFPTTKAAMAFVAANDPDTEYQINEVVHKTMTFEEISEWMDGVAASVGEPVVLGLRTRH
jgi:hypothetical protein